jgi:hypothetical protein
LTIGGAPYWNWARLLGRVFALAMATCPFCRRDSLRIIAAITQESVITRILRHLKLASVPPPIAPARCRQELFVFDEAHTSVAQRRRARRGRVFRPFAPVKSRLTSSPPFAPETDEASASPILSGMSRPRYAERRAAVAGHRCVLGEPPAPRVRSGHRRRRAEGVAGKKWLCISYPCHVGVLGAAPDSIAMGVRNVRFFSGVPPSSWTPPFPFPMVSPKAP